MANSIFSKVDYSIDSDHKNRLRNQLFGEKRVLAFNKGYRRHTELTYEQLEMVNAAMGINNLKQENKQNGM